MVLLHVAVSQNEGLMERLALGAITVHEVGITWNAEKVTQCLTLKLSALQVWIIDLVL
jgi:hypothetical protein